MTNSICIASTFDRIVLLSTWFKQNDNIHFLVLVLSLETIDISLP